MSSSWLPLSAITRKSRGLWAVYVVETNDAGASTVAQRYAEVVHFEQDRVFVVGTIEPGTVVVADGTHRIVVGQTVQPVALPDGLWSRLDADSGLAP